MIKVKYSEAQREEANAIQEEINRHLNGVRDLRHQARLNRLEARLEKIRDELGLTSDF
jgi:hypothetical protein